MPDGTTEYHAFNIAKYLHLPFVGVNELAVFAAALIGAGVSFLWFNTFPAQLMGDVGSLALGGAIGMLAVLTKNELQCCDLRLVCRRSSVGRHSATSYKTTGKRVFRMAPIHHHFES